MNPLLTFCALGVVLALAGCGAAPTHRTAMGASPACDLRIDVGANRGCAVQHVTPVDETQQLTNSLRTQEITNAPYRR